jgi:hypothetical protein
MHRITDAATNGAAAPGRRSGRRDRAGGAAAFPNVLRTRFASYHELGELKGAIARRADDVIVDDQQDNVRGAGRLDRVLEMSGCEHRLMFPEFGFDLEKSPIVACEFLTRSKNT